MLSAIFSGAREVWKDCEGLFPSAAILKNTIARKKNRTHFKSDKFFPEVATSLMFLNARFTGTTPPGIWFIGEVYWVYWHSESWAIDTFKRIQKNTVELGTLRHLGRGLGTLRHP